MNKPVNAHGLFPPRGMKQYHKVEKVMQARCLFHVKYVLNRASKTEIAEHLRDCDDDFVPPLSSRVEIEEYAEKIQCKATRFEAWVDDNLIGLIAAYFNDKEKQCAFITSVSVFREWTGKGIGSELLQQCLGYAKTSSMKQLSLDVAVNNLPAIRLYKKNGFIVNASSSSMFTMSLDNGEKNG